MINFLAVDDRKAGMEGIDKEKINKIISDASKDSRFHLFEQRRQKRIERRIERRTMKLQSFTPTQLLRAKMEADKYLEFLEQTFDTSSTIMHLDLDAFFAAVEIRDRPELAELPVAVGSTSMLSTSNYVARKYGVRAAMPGFIAKKLCPDLVILPVNFAKYRQVSRQVMQILSEYDAAYCSISLDEAYVNLTQYLNAHPEYSAESLVQKIRQRICETTGGLTASAGIACNPRLAKLCTDVNKPNGQFMLPVGEKETVRKFIKQIDLRKINGIGKVTGALLNGMEIFTCGDLFDKRAELFLLERKLSFQFLMQVSIGYDAWRLGESDSDGRRTIGHETTFSATADFGELLRTLEGLCMSLGRKLQSKRLVTSKIVLKLKTMDFHVLTKTRSLTVKTDRAKVFFNEGKSVLSSLMGIIKDSKIRLLGVRAANMFESDEDGRLTALDEFLKQTAEDTGPADSCVRSDLQVGDIKQVEPGSDMFDGNESKTKEILCPVCSTVKLNGNDLMDVNKHIDECLNLNALQTKRKCVKTRERQTSIDEFIKPS